MTLIDGALDVAELGRRADRLDLDLLDEVDAGLGSRDAVARAGEVRAVDEELVLVGAGAERRDGRRWCRLPGEVGEIPGAALMESNMLARRVGIVLRSSGPKRVPNPGSRASMREPAPRPRPIPRGRPASGRPSSRWWRLRRCGCLLRDRSRIPGARCRARTIPGAAAGKRSCLSRS